MKWILYVTFICLPILSISQSVGIGTPTPDASAKLEISSTNSGILIPRMDKAQRNAIVSPAQGLLVFQKFPDSLGFYYYSGSNWVWLQNTSGAGSGWSTTGNAGTDTSVHFIGTTDDMPLKFKVNNQTAGILDANRGNAAFGAEAYSKYSGHSLNSTAGNVAIGGYALSQDTVGSFNTAVGYHSMKETVSPDGQNTAVGSFSLRYIDGFQNSAFGSSAMEYLNDGNFNTALGAYAYTNKTSGTGNTAVGWGSMSPSIYRPVSGNYNTAVGLASLKNNRSGSGAVAIGYNAAYSDTAADGIVAIGRAALYYNNGKSGNIAIGDSSLYNNNNGTLLPLQSTDNVAIGNHAMFSNTNGFKNTATGAEALYSNIGGYYNLANGFQALYSNTDGYSNTAAGAFALWKNSLGNKNVALGVSTLGTNSNGNSNTAIGTEALAKNTAGNANSALGYLALNFNSTGNNNSAVGDSALYKNTTGYSNVAIGAKALAKNTIVSNLVAIGDSALYNAGSTGINFGKHNTAVGSKALYSLVDYDGNTAVGYNALYHVVGFGNTAVGSFAGHRVTGQLNVFIGVQDQSLTGTKNISGSIHIGNLAGENETTSDKLYIENSNANKDNALIYGDFAADSLQLNAKTIVRDKLAIKGSGGNTGLELGYGVAGKEANAGRIGYNLFGSNVLDVIGAGTTSMNRTIKLWAEGGTTFNGSIAVTGNASITGTSDIDGFTRLGTSASGAPRIKMKELTGTTASTNNGQQPISLGGVDPLKIISVSTLVGIASNAVWLPPGYDSDPRLKYNYFVHTNGNLYIQNNSTDCISAGDHICNKTVKIVITYKE